MATVMLKGNQVNTLGDLPGVGDNLEGVEFRLTGQDLTDVKLADFKGKRIIINIFASLDTSVCANSVRRFNEEAGNLNNTVVLCISRDLPFAQGRFCAAEGLENVVTLSEFRDSTFSDAFGIRLIDGPMEGLLARSVVVLDEKLKVIHSQLVPEITQEPDYESVLNIL
jgi:thiol peroxidase